MDRGGWPEVLAPGRVGRREVLRGLALGGAVLGGGLMAAGGAGLLGARRAQAESAEFRSPLIFHSPRLEPFADELPMLPTITGSALTLAARVGSHSFHRDLPAVPSLGYNDMDHLGPTIEAHTGQPLHLTFRNELGAHPLGRDMDHTLHGVDHSYMTHPPTSFHLHGGATPPESDGNAMQMSRPGQAHDHHFPNAQQSSQLWYHDHAMGITRLNVYAGLAGMYLLRDQYDTGLPGNPLGLPAGEFEMPLVLQEKIFTDSGAPSARSTPVVPEGSWEGGAVGDVGLVNGKVWPRLAVARGLYRFRLINAASFSVWTLYLSNHMRFWVIGNDGGLLDAPVAVDRLRVAPAERYDILVDFSGLAPGESVELRNDEEPPFQAAILGEVAMPVFCRFIAGAGSGFTGPIPQSLRGGPWQPPALPPADTPTVFRDVTVSQPYALWIPPAIMTLNNLHYTDPDIEMPRQGTVEQWNIINITPDPHPIHLHLIMFRILGRHPLRTLEYQAAHPQPAVGTKWTPSAENFLGGPLIPPQPWESGWKDTVLVPGGSVTRIIVYFPTADELGFDPDAVFSSQPSQPGNIAPAHHEDMHGGDQQGGDLQGGDLQGYVWHCHLLDHEDHDMMLRFRTIV
ncbi:multicopper oxidase family protein [Tomitella biformata]|uniref:multicopper oxidase family protein n=1 Tax=Tomitella biformata TaxID=630403 RepID=UPI000463FF28|nr:multicopper oxidase domain-containing protein [Tomitella biformata]